MPVPSVDQSGELQPRHVFVLRTKDDERRVEGRSEAIDEAKRWSREVGTVRLTRDDGAVQMELRRGEVLVYKFDSRAAS